jgi:hypothetical protein
MIAVNSADTVATSGIVVTAQAGVSSGNGINVDEIFSNTSGVFLSGEDGSSLHDRKVQPMDNDAWTAEHNARFKELAREEALRELSIPELAELESLTRRRRFKKYPRSAEEILRERQQQKLTRSLVQALKDYVRFHEAASHT